MKHGSAFSFLASTLLLFSTNAFSQYVLQEGQQLASGQALYSGDNAYYVIMQTDGNLVIYRAGGGSTWASNTSGSGATRAVMQTDGNLVLYNTRNQPVWSSNTSGNPHPYLYVDGSWGGIRMSKVVVSWASNTSNGLNPPNSAPLIFQQDQVLPMGQDYYQANGVFNFRFQTDGNLVLYKNGAAIWTSNTSNKGAVKAAIGARGLQLYDASGKTIWSMKNDGSGAAGYMAFQADGNLVYYASVQVWGAGPAGRDNSGYCYTVPTPSACKGFTVPITFPF